MNLRRAEDRLSTVMGQRAPRGPFEHGAGENGGFTLIELMIVVGIIGLLASISGPLYERYQSKVRQSEAKMSLSSIFSSEKAFYSEYTAYISSMDALHYMPQGLKRFYTVGWNAPMVGTVLGYSGSYGTATYDSQNTPGTFGCGPSTAKPLLPPPVGSDAQAFVGGAVGEVRIGQGCDIWTIDQDKDLRNTVPKI